MVLGLLLWTRDDSLIMSSLNMADYPRFSFLLSTWFFVLTR